MIDRKLSGTPPRFPMPQGTIDTQMHMYLPDFPARDGGPGLPPLPLPTPQMYRQAMDWLGIDRVVVTQANAYQHDNDCLLACLDDMGDVARGVAVISPDTTDTEIEALSAAGVIGARIMDLPGGAVGLDQIGGVEPLANAVGWMMAVQFDGSALPDLEPQLSQLRPDWVIDHHAKIFDGATQAHVDVIKRLIDRGNVWFKFAGCYESSRDGGPDFPDIAWFARQIAEHAPERIVWGTNWPHNGATVTEDYPNDAALIDLALSWMPDDRARQLALVDNPAKLYRF